MLSKTVMQWGNKRMDMKIRNWIASILCVVGACIISVIASPFQPAYSSEVIIPGLMTQNQCTTQSISLSACAENNYNVINHRLNFAVDDTKGFIIPSGIYPVPTLPFNSDASLKGAGAGVTVLKFVAVAGLPNNGTVIDVSSTVNRQIYISLSDMSLDGGGIANGLQLKDTVNSHIQNLSLLNVFWGVIVRENNSTLYLDNITIKNDAGSPTMVGGMTIGQLAHPTNTQSNTDVHVTNVLVQGDYVANGSSPVCQYGILVQSGISGLYANRLSAVKCEVGVAVVKASGADTWTIPEWIFCTDCLADTNQKTGWLIQDARGLTLNSSWAGYSGNTGLDLVNVSSASIQAMKIYNNGGDGIRVEAGSQDIIIQGNLVEQNGMNGTTSNGIYTAGAQVITRNNIVRNTTGVVTQTPTPPLTCGINRGGGTVLGASVTDNIIQNATTPVC